MYEKFRSTILDAAKNETKMVMFQLLVMENADQLQNADARHFCHEVGVPESYAREFRKMVSLARLLSQRRQDDHEEAGEVVSSASAKSGGNEYQLRQIKQSIELSSKSNQKMVHFHYYVLLLSNELNIADGLDFCRSVGVPESYKTEYRRMVRLGRLIREHGKWKTLVNKNEGRPPRIITPSITTPA